MATNTEGPEGEPRIYPDVDPELERIERRGVEEVPQFAREDGPRRRNAAGPELLTEDDPKPRKSRDGRGFLVGCLNLDLFFRN
jgi:hypothetical protein